MSTAILPRSYLYVPAHRSALLGRAPQRGADAIIADLEDGVPLDRKMEASKQLHTWLSSQLTSGTVGSQVWVRLHPETWRDALDVLAHPTVTGVVVPKAESSRQLEELDRALTTAEEPDREGPVVVLPLIESARGLRAVGELATAPRVQRLGMGEADLIGELGLEPDATGTPLMPARWEVVVASAAAGLAPPVASTSTDYRNLEAVEAATRQLKARGFRARTAIHPAQVQVINQVFTPTSEEIHHARALITAWETQGGGAVTGPDGRMVDEAVLRSAREVLARARS